MKETKIFTAEIIDFKIDDTNKDEPKGIVDAHVSTFDNIDLVDDIVESTAFNKTLKESKERAAFFMHQTDLPNFVGKASLKKDQKGIQARFEIDLLDKNAAKAYRGVQSGAIDRTSIGFQVIKQVFEEIKGRTIRRIKELKLFEVSLIPIGMAANPEALVSGFKSLNDLFELAIENKDIIDVNFIQKIVSLSTKLEPEVKEHLLKPLLTSTPKEDKPEQEAIKIYKRILQK